MLQRLIPTADWLKIDQQVCQNILSKIFKSGVFFSLKVIMIKSKIYQSRQVFPLWRLIGPNELGERLIWNLDLAKLALQNRGAVLSKFHNAETASRMQSQFARHNFATRKHDRSIIMNQHLRGTRKKNHICKKVSKFL